MGIYEEKISRYDYKREMKGGTERSAAIGK